MIPPGAHGAGFGVLTSASLVGMASSPFIAGFLGGASIRIVFLVDLALMAMLALAVRSLMQRVAMAGQVPGTPGPSTRPRTTEA